MIAVLLVAMMLVPVPVVAEQIDIDAAERAGEELLVAIAENQRAIARVMELLEEEQRIKRERHHTRKYRRESVDMGRTTTTTTVLR